MAISITAYDQLWNLAQGGLNLKTSTLSVRLVTSGYTFNAAHTLWDNGANNSTDPSYNEVANGSGYSTGGIVLSGASANNSRITYNTATWTALTKTFRAAIVVGNGTFDTIVNPLLAYLLLDTTPADIVSSGSNYSIIWNATNGLFYRPA